uniref:Uncharacterized protein n=1 Tax=Rhizophora mucronata TaxID=61149 RepID=A0A2P2M281_RHIMU
MLLRNPFYVIDKLYFFAIDPLNFVTCHFVVNSCLISTIMLKVLSKIWSVALRYHLRMPPYYTLVLRSLASLEGKFLHCVSGCICGYWILRIARCIYIAISFHNSMSLEAVLLK